MQRNQQDHLIQALTKNVKEIAVNAADYLHDRYLMEPEKEGWRHIASNMLITGKNMMDYSDKDWKETLGKDDQDLTAAKINFMNTIVHAAVNALEDMKDYQKKTQETALKEFSVKDTEKQQKARRFLNGEVELSHKYKTSLGNVIEEQQARIRVYQEGVKQFQNNMKSINLPIKDEVIELSEKIRSHLKDKRENLPIKELKNSIGYIRKLEGELKVAELKLTYHLASKEDFRKIIYAGRDVLTEMKKEKQQAVRDNVEVSTMNRLHKTERDIKDGFAEISRQLFRHSMEKENEKLKTRLQALESKLELSEKNHPIQRSALMNTSKDKRSDSDPVKNIIQMVTDYQTGRYKYPSDKDLFRLSGTKNDKLYQYEQQNMFRLASSGILARVKQALDKDKQLSDGESRNLERKALLSQVIKFSVGTKKEIEKGLKQTVVPIGLEKKDLIKLNHLLKEYKQTHAVTNYKSLVKENALERAIKLQYTGNKKTRKHSLGVH